MWLDQHVQLLIMYYLRLQLKHCVPITVCRPVKPHRQRVSRPLIESTLAYWCFPAGFGKLEKRVRTTGGGASGSVRNLRIREDTAKYLHNLDPNSAHYDPKSRSMRADPQPHKPANEKAFMGDNWTRQSGDFHGLQALTVHSVNAQKSGSEIHPQAAPSQVKLLCPDMCELGVTYHSCSCQTGKLQITQKSLIFINF